MAGGDSEERKLPPSPRKLRRLRESGQVASSQDFPAALAFCSGLVVIALTAHVFVDLFASGLLLAADAAVSPRGSSHPVLIGQIGLITVQSLAPLLVVTGVAGVMAHTIFKGGLVVSIKPVTPEFGRLNPVQGLKKLFGFRSLVEFPLILLRCVVLLTASGIVIYLAVPSLLAAPQCGMSCVMTNGATLLRDLLLLAVLIVLTLGLLDLPLQTALFRHEQKMSRSEMKQENKQDHGHPEIRKKRKEEHRRLAEQGAGSALDQMTLVITSSDVAVALSYDPSTTPVPVVVGKGSSERRSKILAQAKAMQTPVENNLQLADDLSRVGIGAMVPQSLFQDVAMALVRHGLAKRTG